MFHPTSTSFCPSCQAVHFVNASVRTLDRPHSPYPQQAALVYTCSNCGAIIRSLPATCAPSPDLVPSSA